ncbi:MAG: hypothetical protein B9S28_02395 [Opitutia bacterium Tous-C10FEB]|nr:MAG: hypothetical protein B9S28_02395 [Opitutae bacterium Tous-C10FEB]
METELLILGGGCAGLSLARRLSAHGEAAPRTTVIESRCDYADDRTWCFWLHPSAQLTHLVRRRWSSVSVASPKARTLVACADFPYAMLPAGEFYQESIKMLGRSEQMRLDLGVSVFSAPRKVGEVWEVATSGGTYRAKWVVDTRPLVAPARGGAVLWQSFLGQEVECAAPIFDSDIAEIMHFTSRCDGQILFYYLLPISPTRALLEVTVFAPEPTGPEVFRSELTGFIDRRLHGHQYWVRRTEHGILPMGMLDHPSAADGSYVRAGLMAGGARASSGYAFQRIQRWAEECAQALVAGRGPTPHRADPWALRKMDALFLQVLSRRPELAADLFLALFQRVAHPRLVRFMSDRATLADYAAIIFALPARPFLKELFSPA